MKKYLNMGLDLIGLIGIIAIMYSSYNKLELNWFCAYALIKLIINSDIKHKKNMYIIFIGLLLNIIAAVVSYFCISDITFEIKDNIVLTCSVMIVVGLMLYRVKSISYYVNYMICFLLLLNIFNSNSVYIKGRDAIVSKYGDEYVKDNIDPYINAGYKFIETNYLDIGLALNKTYKDNLYKIIKLIENDTKYVSEINNRESENKLEELTNIALKFIKDTNNGNAVEKEVLYNTDYIDETIGKYRKGK